MQGRIYFDNAATTPLDPRVLEAMLPWFGERFGNSDSRTHPFGWEAEEGVEQAREEIAAILGASPPEIVFTSGATESNNLALKGVLRATGQTRRHFITTAIEHAAVLAPARALKREGFELTVVAPDADGRIDPGAIERAIREDTALCSVIHGNNEIGVIQDLPGIARVCTERGVLLHTDATQSVGRIPCEVERLGVDLLSCSAHKMHGPKGAGALFVRRRVPRIDLAPLLDGGGQERGRRSGTLNVPAIVGFGRACALAREAMEVESRTIARLRDGLEEGLLRQVPGARRNGPAQGRLPGISNLSFSGLDSEALLLAIRSVALSAGSACASARSEPSPVLLALGLDEALARGSLRFSLGRFNTATEVETVIGEIAAAVARLRGEAVPS